MKRLIKSNQYIYDTMPPKGEIDGKTAFDIAMEMWAAAPESLKSPSADTKMHDMIAAMLKQKYYDLRSTSDPEAVGSATIAADTEFSISDEIRDRAKALATNWAGVIEKSDGEEVYLNEEQSAIINRKNQIVVTTFGRGGDVPKKYTNDSFIDALTACFIENIESDEDEGEMDDFENNFKNQDELGVYLN